MAAETVSDDRLGQLRLLLALDALLVEGSVGGAARKLGIGPSAMSRTLAQIRDLYGDPIMVRRGGGLVPTEFAEGLRLRLRALVSEADALLEPASLSREGSRLPTPVKMYGIRDQAPPLSLRPVDPVEGAPNPENIARKLAGIASINDPRIRLARHIAIIGGGAGRSRPLTEEEADDAFAIILNGDADPIQVGAFLMLLQHRHPSPAELAGMVRAARRLGAARSFDDPGADLDWPVYVSPRNRTAPWYLHAARLLALDGHRVLLHSRGAPDEISTHAFEAAGVARCESVEEAAKKLREHPIAFLPLHRFSEQLAALLELYGLFELRSPLNQLVHLLNPIAAPASILGVAGTRHRELQRDTAALLGFRSLTAISSHRDVAQATPFRATKLLGVREGAKFELVLPSSEPVVSPPLVSMTSIEFWEAIWTGSARDERAAQIIIATAAIALMAISKSGDFLEHHVHASHLWRDRLKWPKN